jgi:potassium-dependent mechanosensitive channel
MTWESVLTWTAVWLVRPLFSLAGTEVTLLSLVIFVAIIIATLVISKIVKRAVDRTVGERLGKNEGSRAAILRLFHYVILLIGFGVALQTIGINMNALFAAGAVFAVAIGFAMQNVVQNFVSGVILLAERSIKPGDILEIEGTVVKVVEMRIRTTVVRTWRDEELIMPNSILSQGVVKNYTLRDEQFRLGVEVGVTYQSDMKQVIQVLEDTAAAMPWRLPEPPPRVVLREFGSSSVDFGVYVTVDEPWNQRLYRSEMRQAVWFAFKDAGITIAFPQLDVHFDPPIVDSVTSVARPSLVD